MRALIFYDKETDSAYIELSDQQPSGVVEIDEGLNVDTTESGEITGIEFLNASQKFPIKNLFSFEVNSDQLEKTRL